MFNINLMLADAAQVADGKLYILGGGWSWLSSGMPFAVCGKIEIPWDVRGTSHTLRLELVDSDGNPFQIPREMGQDGVPFVVDHPPFDPAQVNEQGLKAGVAVGWPFAVNVGPGLPLKPDVRYEWRIIVDGAVEEGWTLPFTVRAAV